MFSQFAKFIYALVILLLVAVGVWKFLGTRRANEQVAAANAAVNQGQEYFQQAATKFDEIFNEENSGSFPGNRESLKKLAHETIELAGKGAEQFNLAAQKFEQASNEGTGEKIFHDYWLLKSKINKKIAEANQAIGDGAKLVLDESIATSEDLKAKGTEALHHMQEAMGSAKEMAAQSEKLEADNKDKFEKRE